MGGREVGREGGREGREVGREGMEGREGRTEWRVDGPEVWFIMIRRRDL